MFCKNCGSNIGNNVKFCPSCGKPTGVSGSPQPDGGTNAAAGQSQGYPYNTGSGNGYNPAQNNYQNSSQSQGQNYSQNFTARPAYGTPQAKFKKPFNIGNYVVWGGCLIALISLFLNFVSVNAGFLGSESVKLIDTEDAPFFIGIFVIVAIVNFFRLNIADLIGSLIAALLVFVELNSIKEAYEQYGDWAKSLAESFLEYGAGRTCLILGILLMVGSSVAAIVLGINAKKAAGIQNR